MEEVIKLLEAKGMKDARPVIEELQRAGAFTHFDANKYAARHKVMVRIAKETTSSSCIIRDVAYEYNMSYGTLRDVL